MAGVACLRCAEYRRRAEMAEEELAQYRERDRDAESLRQITEDKVRFGLTPKEAIVFGALRSRGAGNVCSYEELMSAAWADGEKMPDGALDALRVKISQVRQKTGFPVPAVYGVGYHLGVEAQS